MSRGDKRWIVAGSIAALAGVGWLAVHERTGARRHPATPDRAPGDGFQGFSSRPFSGVGASPAAPETPEAIAQHVDDVMARWRTAILVKDAHAVVALDLTFRQEPARFTAALEKSADADANERIRAFSTRVLGKQKNAAEAPLYRRLLSDKSPYVRQNAAWALGELGAAAEPALAELQKASTKDPANDVRAAARDALGKL